MIGPFRDKFPNVAPSAFVHLLAEIRGDVSIGENSAVFHFCSLRGDINRIEIGSSVNVQEHSTLHVSDGNPCVLREWVTVGHHAVIHGALIEKGALVGIGAVIMDGAVIGEEALVAAGAVVTPGMKVPPRTLVAGTPARPVRELRAEEIQENYRRAARYIEQLAPWYKKAQEEAQGENLRLPETR